MTTLRTDSTHSGITIDYANGTNSELYKYQWDYIHNPQQGIVRWMVEDDESESANPFGDEYDPTCADFKSVSLLQRKINFPKSANIL